MKNLFDLTHKVTVITGGGGLLGKAFARGFASYGAQVIIAEIDEEKGIRACEELKKDGYTARFLLLDIADEKSVINGVTQILKEEGRIDVWINNAYPRTKDWGVSFEKIPFNSWQENINKHLNGYCLCCQKVTEIMKEAKKGSIINIASIYGIVAPDFSIYEGTDMTMPAAYAAIKGGVIQFTKYLASYYGNHGVRVNAISPGGIFDSQPQSFVKNYIKKTPLQRMASAEEIVGAAIFLASDASAYVTGHNLVVDGGWSII